MSWQPGTDHLSRPIRSVYEDGHPTLLSRENDLHELAQKILEHPEKWGLLDPDQCVALAEGLLAMRWLVADIKADREAQS